MATPKTPAEQWSATLTVSSEELKQFFRRTHDSLESLDILPYSTKRKLFNLISQHRDNRDRFRRHFEIRIDPGNSLSVSLYYFVRTMPRSYTPRTWQELKPIFVCDIHWPFTFEWFITEQPEALSVQYGKGGTLLFPQEKFCRPDEDWAKELAAKIEDPQKTTLTFRDLLQGLSQEYQKLFQVLTATIHENLRGEDARELFSEALGVRARALMLERQSIRLIAAIEKTIEVLRASKSFAKSKALAQAREDLEAVIK